MYVTTLPRFCIECDLYLLYFYFHFITIRTPSHGIPTALRDVIYARSRRLANFGFQETIKRLVSKTPLYTLWSKVWMVRKIFHFWAKNEKIDRKAFFFGD